MIHGIGKNLSNSTQKPFPTKTTQQDDYEEMSTINSPTRIPCFAPEVGWKESITMTLISSLPASCFYCHFAILAPNFVGNSFYFYQHTIFGQPKISQCEK